MHCFEKNKYTHKMTEVCCSNAIVLSDSLIPNTLHSEEMTNRIWRRTIS